MLDGLDEVAWSTSTHAYGEASDVPTLLRQVAGGGAPGHAALAELFNTIWHQGTVYDATSAAVPFLAELALSPQLETELRLLLLALLFAIGRGRGYLEVHRESMSRLGHLPDDVDEQQITESQWVSAARRAAADAARRCIEEIESVPDRLWLSVATLALIAGDYGRMAIVELLKQADSLPPFGASGIQAVAELVGTGRLADDGKAVSALDDELADYRAQSGGEAVTIHSYFVDVLVERLCDSDGRGSAAG